LFVHQGDAATAAHSGFCKHFLHSEIQYQFWNVFPGFCRTVIWWSVYKLWWSLMCRPTFLCCIPGVPPQRRFVATCQCIESTDKKFLSLPKPPVFCCCYSTSLLLLVGCNKCSDLKREVFLSMLCHRAWTLWTALVFLQYGVSATRLTIRFAKFLILKVRARFKRTS
jgi:hypothetical protein